MPYKITFLEKSVERDNYNLGCIGETKNGKGGSCMHAGWLRPVTRETLADAVTAMFSDLGLPTDYFFIGDETGAAHFISCNRQENDEGLEPTEREMERFKADEIDLWLADYSFALEYVTARPATREELSAAFPSAEIE